MTAANIFARREGTWMFFDTACYDDEGYVIDLRSKVVTSPALNIAIGRCGRFGSNANEMTSDWLAEQTSQAEALANVPELLRRLSDHAKAATLPRPPLWRVLTTRRLKRPPGTPGIRLLVAWWDAEHEQGEAAIISDDDHEGDDYPAFQLCPFENLGSPTPASGPWFDWKFEFDPRTDALRLAELQRREPNDDGEYRVGGSYEGFRVHAAGVDQFNVCTWPDRVGAKLCPCSE